MPQKKPSAYMIFVIEWKNKNAPKLSIPEAVSRAGSIWKNMSETQKQVYKDQAKTAPNLPGSNKRGKLTCDGTPIELIEKQQRDAQLQLDLMKKNIKDTINNALNDNKLLSKRFYFIMCNHFVRILHTEDYVPAEVALVEFSLETGVNYKFHAFVNPKMEFYGNVYEAKHHSETTHQLPLPPDAFGDKEMQEIFSDILEFIHDKEAKTYPPLYTYENCMPVIKSCLQFLMDSNKKFEKVNLNIYSIQQLFYDLKCASSEYSGNGDAPKNKYISDAALDRDAFQYETNIACQYHEDIDRAHYCALSQVIRWAFTFADYIGKDVNLKFIPGKHIPERFHAEKIHSMLQEQFKDTSLQSVCDRISEISLSDYQSCDEFVPVRSRKTIFKPPQPPRSKTSQCNTSILTVSDIGSTSNPWKRHDTSEAPDPRHFDLDYEEKQPTVSTRRTSGRGIAIFEDFPSLCSNGRGHGNVPRL